MHVEKTSGSQPLPGGTNKVCFHLMLFTTGKGKCDGAWDACSWCPFCGTLKKKSRQRMGRSGRRGRQRRKRLEPSVFDRALGWGTGLFQKDKHGLRGLMSLGSRGEALQAILCDK